MSIDEPTPGDALLSGGGGSTLATDFLRQVVIVAAHEVGVRETAPNRGARVDEYLRAAGLDPERGSLAWCQAFVFWVIERAARQLGVPNPAVRTGRVSTHWLTAPPHARIKVLDEGGTVLDRERIRPGCIYLADRGGGKGHTGVVEGIDYTTGEINSIEGNTDLKGDREGDGVYRTVRPIAYASFGFIDYGLVVARAGVA